MISKEKIFNQIQHLLNAQYFGVLATQGIEYPYCTLVGYAASPDYKEIIFATIRETRKYKNLKKTPNVSMLIDSQTNQVNDFKNTEALTVLGSAREVDTNSDNDYLAIYLKKHPYLKEFVSEPNCALIKVNASKYILVNNFQNVREYTIL
jgi:nitroimidazol reductase NimA-like FMN-containing flavoprotein (pyridoxamine 5'-phosphate oxidase superfamily)